MAGKELSGVYQIYKHLIEVFGPQQWWPGETILEIIVGAVLTQNTNWFNVEKAIENLKRANVLTLQALYQCSHHDLSSLIKPAGYFNLKAKRLKNVIHFIMEEYAGDFALMKKENVKSLRKKLLAVNGVGQETADSILLYAFNKQMFVIDAYTRRIFYRHGLTSLEVSYEELQREIIDSIPRSRKIYNEFHALIVKIGKDYCKPKPKCESCPLNKINYSIEHQCAICFKSNFNSDHCLCG